MIFGLNYGSHGSHRGLLASFGWNPIKVIFQDLVDSDEVARRVLEMPEACFRDYMPTLVVFPIFTVSL